MSAIVNVNGRITSEQEAVISVFDHGFLYGVLSVMLAMVTGWMGRVLFRKD